MPRLIVFAGPNGSGKSTFISQMAAGTRKLEFSLPERVVNPDEFARAINPLFPDAVEVEAARAVLLHRSELLSARLDFAIETTLSGHGELRFLQKARDCGYEIGLVYVATEDPNTNVLRIELRRAEQNRSVSTAAVRRRYERSLAQISNTAAFVDLAYIFDNTGSNFVEILRFRGGQLISRADRLPTWAKNSFAGNLK